MKNFLKLTLAVVLMLSTTTVFAQKFGRVDLAAIVTNMPEFKEAQTNLEAYGKDLQDQLEQIQVEFNTKYAEYEKNVGTYTDAVRQLKEAELQQLQQRFTDFQQIAQQDMQKKEADVMNPIYDKANEAVKKVASEGGYLAIFSTTQDQPAAAGLAYFDAAALTDITAAVKTELGIVE
ncbi:MAG: OmpH family outer membrane protein [Alistipes sp.]|nr:OmpH family outer membrane protein [Alistipes sp.]